MRKRVLIGLVCLAALTAASLACTIGVGGPTPPASPIPISTEAAGDFEQTLEEALKNSKNGEVTVVITEQQLTSFIAIKLAEQPDTPIKDVQVYLRDSQMVIYGTATVRGISAPAIIKLNVATTPEGKLEVTVADADFGPMPVPASMLESLSSGVNEMLSGQFGPQATGVKITAVTIADGQMTVSGIAS